MALPQTGTFEESRFFGEARRDVIKQLALEVPWLPWQAVKAFVDYWTEGAAADDAWAEVQRDERYDEWFPGNRRPDGTIRLPEAAYYGTMQGYKNVLRSVGVRVRPFINDLPTLIQGDVTVSEFASRVSQVTSRVLHQLPAIQKEYADLWNVDMDRESIIASLIKPGLGAEMLERRIGMAEIAGEATEQDFDITKQMAQQMFEAGVGRGDARNTFAQAAEFLPVLSVLARRHADPDDDFDLEEFVSSTVYNDPEQRARMRRLMNQERVSFVTGGSFSIGRDQGGALTGLEAR